MTRVRDTGALFMMFLTGEPQISRAIIGAGISSQTEAITTVYEDEEDLKKFLQEFPAMVPAEQEMPTDDPEPDELIFPRMAKVELTIS